MTVGKKISIVCALLVACTITLGAVVLVSMSSHGDRHPVDPSGSLLISHQ